MISSNVERCAEIQEKWPYWEKYSITEMLRSIEMFSKTSNWSIDLILGYLEITGIFPADWLKGKEPYVIYGAILGIERVAQEAGVTKEEFSSLIKKLTIKKAR